MEEQLRLESSEQIRIRRKRLERNENRIAELKRLYRGAKECFRRKYLLGSGGIYSMISLPDTKGEQKNPAVDTGLIQNLTDSKDMDGIAQYLDAIYKEVEGSLDYHGLKQISRELFMLLKKNYAHLPKQMGQDFSTASNFSDWLDSRISERGSSVSLKL